MAYLRARLATKECSAASTTLHAPSVFFCECFASNSGARLYSLIENGADAVVWASRAIRSAPPRAACIGISQQWRAYLTDGHSVSPAQVTSFKVKEKYK